jgi:predicted solute-binding protein
MSEGVAGITLTPEQLQELLAGAIKAAIAPSPEAQKNADDLKARTENSRRSSLQAMEAVRTSRGLIQRQKSVGTGV